MVWGTDGTPAGTKPYVSMVEGCRNQIEATSDRFFWDGTKLGFIGHVIDPKGASGCVAWRRPVISGGDVAGRRVRDRGEHRAMTDATCDDSLSVADLDQLIALCDRFEADWKLGRARSIEDELREAPERLRERLLCDLLAVELEVRTARGEALCQDEYRGRFPDLAGVIEAAFAALREASPARGTGGSGRFRILRFHGRGGLGEVYIARDEELGREVALKKIRPDRDGEELRARFVLEAKVTGGLEYPGIVPIYSLGVGDDGRPFYAMRYLGDDSLSQVMKGYHERHPRPDPTAVEFRKLLGRFVAICEVIAYSHSRGVLHRDLKPQNVMLGRFGETLIIDWGLARCTGAGDSGGVPLALL